MNQSSHGGSILQVGLVLNPHSRQAGSLKQQIQDEFASCGNTNIEVVMPELKDYTQEILKLADRVDVLAVAGGDGTLNLALEEPLLLG
jgi:diacylglycerol kinase family enzyme